MNTPEAARVLAAAAAYDNRHVTEEAATALAAALPDINLDEALKAVVAHYRESEDWLKPAHIVNRVRQARRQAIERLPECPIHGMPGRDGNCDMCAADMKADPNPRRMKMLISGNSRNPEDPPTGLPELKPGFISWPTPEALAEMPPDQLAEIEARKQAVQIATTAAKQRRHHYRTTTPKQHTPNRDLARRLEAIEQKIAALQETS